MPSKRRILIDSSTHTSAVVCHLKARSQLEFETWLDLLKHHRLYYQYKWSHASPVTTAPVASHSSTNSPISTNLAAAMATTVTAITPIAQHQVSQSISSIDNALGNNVKSENQINAINSIHASQSSVTFKSPNNSNIGNNVINRYYLNFYLIQKN